MTRTIRPAAALVLFGACARADDGAAIPRHPSPEGRAAWLRYDPVDTPLSWRTDGELFVAHDEQYSRHDVYASSCPGSGFYAVPIGGGAARPLAVGGSACRGLGDQQAAASADGAWVVFSEHVPPDNSRLSRLHLASGRVDPLPTDCAVYLHHPAVSPDGGRIAAVGLCRDRDQPDYWLYVMNSDGSGLRLLSDAPTDEVAPSWSPDGKRLAATQDERIVVMSADGSGRRAVTTGGVPSWSPDGAWIAFLDEMEGTRGGFGIFVVRPDGTGRRQVFRNEVRSTYSRGWGPIPEGLPAPGMVWSPDSRRIAFARSFDRGTHVWTVELATGRLEQVTRPARGQADR